MFNDVLKSDLLELKGKYPEPLSGLIPGLWRVQEEFGFISNESCVELAKAFDVSPANVRGVMTFYTMFYPKQMGKHKIKVCKTVSCWLNGATELVNHLKDKLGIDVGEVSGDKKFSLEVVECLGACDQAPVVHVNETQHDRVSFEAMDKLLSEMK